MRQSSVLMSPAFHNGDALFFCIKVRARESTNALAVTPGKHAVLLMALHSGSAEYCLQSCARHKQGYCTPANVPGKHRASWASLACHGEQFAARPNLTTWAVAVKHSHARRRPAASACWPTDCRIACITSDCCCPQMVPVEGTPGWSELQQRVFEAWTGLNGTLAPPKLHWCITSSPPACCPDKSVRPLLT